MAEEGAWDGHYDWAEVHAPMCFNEARKNKTKLGPFTKEASHNGATKSQGEVCGLYARLNCDVVNRKH